MSELKEDIEFLEEVLDKVDSINLHDRLEGIQMLRDQIKHMKHRETPDKESPR